MLVALVAVAFPFSRATAQAVQTIALNEILASNSDGLADEDGATSDWIELHNSSNGSVDLSGWHLTDDPAQANMWTFPAGTTIAAGSYLVVFASGKDRAVPGSELHTNFRLGTGGEYLALNQADGAVVDAFDPTYPPQNSNISWGRSGGALAFFDDPSPGAANGGEIRLAPVRFGTAHGVMDGPINLALTSSDPDVTIRYTLDGSDPLSGTTYSGPIPIDATTVVRARALRDGSTPSRITTQTYLYLDDVVSQGSPPAGFPTSNVNGQVLDWGMDPDVVNPDPAAVRNSLLAIPSLSLVTDTDHLFDPATGIYVNAIGDGIEWERPGSIELIDPTGADPGFDVNAGIRIRGGYSRRPENPKHSFRLFFRSEYGDAKLQYPLFGDEGADSFDRVDLRSAQNYSWSSSGSNSQNTMLRERWSRETQADMGQPHTRSRHYHLYVNGQYFGVFQTQERVSKDFTSDYLGGDKDDWDIVKHERSDDFRFTASDGTEDAWRELWPLVQDEAVSAAEFATIREQVDLENLADYYLLHFYSGDFDGAPSWYLTNDGKRYTRANNWYAVRDRTGGRWQFFDHDSEHSLCVREGGPSQGTSIDNTNWTVGSSDNLRWSADYLSPDKLHHALLSNVDYRQIFADRTQLHLLDDGGALTTGAAIARLDELAATVGPAVLANSARWGDTRVAEPRGLTEWNGEITWIRDTCFAARRSVLEAQLEADDLFPTVNPPSIPPAAVPWGDDVTITGAGGGSIWYTTDGSDPRGPGGQPSAGAINAATVTITDYTTVTARVRTGGDWSASRTAELEPSTLPSAPAVILNEYNGVGSGEFLSNQGSDSTFGRVRGNGGDWFELVVVAEDADLRGWQLELHDGKGLDSGWVRRDRFVLADHPALSQLEAGTIITISEDHPDDLSFDPRVGDWTINLQANSDLDGALIADGQENFDTNDDNFAVVIRDGTGVVRALRTGEGSTALSGVSDSEVGKLEADPNDAITPASAYDDGTTSTWGLPNRWDDQVQDIDAIRTWVAIGDVDTSLVVDAADVQALLQVLAGDASSPINIEAADLNDDGQVTLLDALVLARTIDPG